MSWIVTGTGAVASIGSTTDEIYGSLVAGRSGLAGLRGYDRSRFRAQVAYEIDDRPLRRRRTSAGHPLAGAGRRCGRARGRTR